MTHKLLLADDSVTIQRVIELTFADEDIDVTAVGDGQLAIERLDADPPDIVLADIDMPKRDGYEVAAYVKSRPKLAHIPVVLLTGAFEQVDLARARAAGSAEVLAKPFEPQMVINRVKQLLGKKPDASVPERPAIAPRQPVMAPRPPARNTAQGEQDQPSQPVSLDDYFDQLDAAFSNLQPGKAAPEHDDMNSVDWTTADQSAPHVSQGVPPGRPVAAQAPRQAEPPITAPAEPAPVKKAWEPESVIASARIAPQPAPAPPPLPLSPPSVVAKPAPEPSARPASTNPFASMPAPAAEVAAAARPAAPVVTEDVINEVVIRVLERMSDRIVRETVTEIVSETAERAVQEEIERIKKGGQ